MFSNLYPYTLAFVFLAIPVTVIALQWYSAPYGRFYRSGWGVRISSKWGWILMESPAVFVFAGVYFQGQYADSQISFFFFVLWQIHYLYRMLIYPILIHRSSNNLSLMVVASAFLFNVINAFNIAYAISEYPPDGFFIMGTILFFSGMGIHVYSDLLLKGVRKGKYRVLNRFLYRFVCAPNYLGEVIQWIGFALAIWSFSTTAFALFTMANLIPRALKSQRWYRKNFPDFPRERRAIFPFFL